MRCSTLLFAVIACGCATQTAQNARPSEPRAPPDRARKAPDFEYDAQVALDVREDGPSRIEGEIAFELLSFASPRGGRVPVMIVRAVRRSPTRGAAVVLQHGMGNLDKTELLPDAVLLARAGAVAILIDGPMARPAALVPRDYANHEHDPELWEHAVVDLRRAIDVLTARSDVDASRIGFVGHSFGGTMGAILSQAEPRVRAFVLIGVGASLTREILTSPRMAGVRARVPKPALDAYVAAMQTLDAEQHVAQAMPTAHMLFQFGLFDEVVERDEAERIVVACRSPKESHSYPTGHFITSPAAMRDRLVFLARELELPRGDDAVARDLAGR